MLFLYPAKKRSVLPPRWPPRWDQEAWVLLTSSSQNWTFFWHGAMQACSTSMDCQHLHWGRSLEDMVQWESSLFTKNAFPTQGAGCWTWEQPSNMSTKQDTKHHLGAMSFYEDLAHGQTTFLQVSCPKCNIRCAFMWKAMMSTTESVLRKHEFLTCISGSVQNMKEKNCNWASWRKRDGLSCIGPSNSGYCIWISCLPQWEETKRRERNSWF